MPKAKFALIVFVPFVLLLASCASLGLGPTPTPEPPTLTPTPTGPQTLNICTAQEPSSLFLYADNSQAARAVRQAIYDGPFDLQGYEPQAVILESVPSLDNGGATLQAVSVSSGQMVVDAEGQPRQLQAGVRVRPAGCRDNSCAVEYDGGELQMDQLSATFTLKSGLTWSDGQPLTAADSVYSFQVNADPATPGDKSNVNFTASYEPNDDHTVVWAGLPGYLDPGYQTNFWTPLPRHAWEGTAAADLATADMAARSPLGWGPYVVSEWAAGQSITLTRSPNYFRASEGLPHFSQVVFHFGSFGAADLASGNCDLLLPSEDADAAALEAAGAQVSYTPSGSWEHLDFGIRPLEFDEGFNVYHNRADFFGDVRMRQAIAMCVDRQALVDQLAYGQGAIPSSYIQPEHLLANGRAAAYTFDPAAGNALLDEIGWVMGADGVRVNQTYTGALAGEALVLTLNTAEDSESQAIAAILQSSLDDCGIGLEISAAPAEQAFAPGPSGAVFGRQFELAQFAWPYGDQPACYLYLSEAIPGQDLGVFKYGWGGWNISGWSNAEYDVACQQAMASLPGEAGYGDAERQAQAIFAEQLPALPLFERVNVAAARADFCGFAYEAGSTLLQSLESYGYAEWCN